MEECDSIAGGMCSRSSYPRAVQTEPLAVAAMMRDVNRRMNAQDQMFELVDVTRVEPRGGYRLALTFSDGTEGERDFAELIAEGGEMVEPLRDQVFFAR